MHSVILKQMLLFMLILDLNHYFLLEWAQPLKINLKKMEKQHFYGSQIQIIMEALKEFWLMCLSDTTVEHSGSEMQWFLINQVLNLI